MQEDFQNSEGRNHRIPRPPAAWNLGISRLRLSPGPSSGSFSVISSLLLSALLLFPLWYLALKAVLSPLLCGDTQFLLASVPIAPSLLKEQLIGPAPSSVLDQGRLGLGRWGTQACRAQSPLC